MLGLIVSLLIIGLIAGAIARLVVPGKQNISIPMTILLGEGKSVFDRSRQDGRSLVLKDSATYSNGVMKAVYAVA